MLDLNQEELLTLKAARSEFPNRPSLPTIWRWILKGSKGIRLDSVRIGGRRYTSKQAVARFIQATTMADRLATRPKRKQSDRKDQSLAAAKLILDQFGV